MRFITSIVLLIISTSLFIWSANAEDTKPAFEIPIICPDLTSGPCKPIMDLGIMINFGNPLLECIRQNPDNPRKCIPREIGVKELGEDPLIVGMQKVDGVGSGGGGFGVSIMSLSAFAHTEGPVILMNAPRGIVISEWCLYAIGGPTGLVDPENIPPECQGTITSLNNLNLTLARHGD